MSFTTYLATIRSDHTPLGLRYTNLRHCVQLYCPFGFNQTWKILESKFGLREGEMNDPSALVAAAEFLASDRNAWLAVVRAHEDLGKLRARAGLPKPAPLPDITDVEPYAAPLSS